MNQNHSGRPSADRGGRLTGPRTTRPGAVGINGWERTEAGGLALTQSAFEAEVSESLYYETPDQIAARVAAEGLAEEQAQAAHAEAARTAERAAVKSIVRARVQSGTSPTRDELQLIADTSLDGAKAHKNHAAAALLAHQISERHPDAAYIAFETTVAPVGFDDIQMWPELTRKAVVLTSDLRRITEYTSLANSDYRLDDPDNIDDDRDLDRSIARVYPMTYDVGSTSRRNDDARSSADRLKYARPTASLNVTAEARSFDDGTHPAIPNLFTVASAKSWVPKPLPFDQPDRTVGQKPGESAMAYFMRKSGDDDFDEFDEEGLRQDEAARVAVKPAEKATGGWRTRLFGRS